MLRAVATRAQRLPARLRDVALVTTALAVRERTGKSLSAQAREVIQLRRGPGRVRPFDYYAYELFDDARYSPAEKREFVGWHPDRVSEQLNDPAWRGLCDDKLLSYALLRGLCLPFPEVYAVYHPEGRAFGDAPSFHSPDAMADFLRSGMRYPFFGKPVKDAWGGGASAVDSIDRERDVLRMQDGREMPVDAYVQERPVARSARDRLARFRSPYRSGYLFQERVRLHPRLAALSGGRMSSLRMVVLLGADGPRLFRVTWRIAVGANVTDHFVGSTGNVKCLIGCESGRVECAVQGRGRTVPEVYALGHHGRRVEAHPDTGERLADFELPHWQRTVALVLRAATAFPGLRYQSWDVAIGPEGPVIIELNYSGGIAQLLGSRGFNDSAFQRYMADVERQRAQR